MLLFLLQPPHTSCLLSFNPLPQALLSGQYYPSPSSPSLLPPQYVSYCFSWHRGSKSWSLVCSFHLFPLIGHLCLRGGDKCFAWKLKLCLHFCGFCSERDLFHWSVLPCLSISSQTGEEGRKTKYLPSAHSHPFVFHISVVSHTEFFIQKSNREMCRYINGRLFIHI